MSFNEMLDLLDREEQEKEFLEIKLYGNIELKLNF
jgi:hypothetical protein